ncbi:hypothetical protein B0H14DRAFT_2336430 [Mycena olivaceomarginata]|nr:hypothetical protein B0H14DRAFT_2336430 [Mycena olivaceomarginata]
METERGVMRGSYIWGRCANMSFPFFYSYDIKHGVGYKWKMFFVNLEVNHGLNVTLAAHIWLLQHLFLHRINKDSQEWAKAWNSHDLTIVASTVGLPATSSSHP